MVSDRELLDAWRRGDRRAGSELVDRHIGSISRFFRNKVASPEDATDLVSQTFLAATSSKDRFRGETSVRRFLYAIAGNVLREYIRRKYKRRSEALDFESICVSDLDPASMSSIVMRKREARMFVRALREIPLGDQIVLELMYFEGLSGREIAELLAIPEGTVRGRLRRGKDRLRTRVEALLTATPSPVDSTVTVERLDDWARDVRRKHGWGG